MRSCHRGLLVCVLAAGLLPVSVRSFSTLQHGVRSGIPRTSIVQRGIGDTNRRDSTRTRLDASPLAAVITTLPLWSKLLATCAIPPCLGFWKQEYGVSYAYGSSVALGAYWIYAAMNKPVPHLAAWHAGALIFYGIRLCVFLAVRQRISQRIREGMERIEARAQERGSRWKRAPFLAFCGLLYYGLTAPLLLTIPLLTSSTTLPRWTMRVLQGLIATTWLGFLLGAAGDGNKTWVKRVLRKNEHHLVTGGIFRWIRHPNYTGEILGWTANAVAAVVAAVAAYQQGGVILRTTQLVAYASASILAAVGMDFVLLQATKGLEKRQHETYGDTAAYDKWVKTSWAGFTLPEKTAAEQADAPSTIKPALEFKVTEEDTGSGI